MLTSPPARSIALLLAFSFPALPQARSGPSVAGFGYRTPANAITAAPGQVMVVSVFGIARRLADPVFPIATNGFPLEVEGLSIDFVQGPLTIQLQIRGIQQSLCPSFGACSPATSFTLQIPFELNPASRIPASLRFKEGEAPVTEVALKGVTDGVHVINTCDQTGIFLSIASDVPPGACAPIVMHARGTLVSARAPAKPGERLLLWAYGMGALDRQIPESCCFDPALLPLVAQPFNVSFSYTDAARTPLGRIGHTAPEYAGMIGGGLYQVHFIVPELPSDAAACNGQNGNLKVLLSGPNSADSADICVQP